MPSTNKKRIEETLYAEVAPAVPLPTHKAQSFTYQVRKEDEEKLKVFSLVMIPFGPRKIKGIVLRLHHQKPHYNTKELELISSSFSITANQIAFGAWISSTMNGSLGFTLRLLYPPSELKKHIDEEKEIATSPLPKRTISKEVAAYWKKKKSGIIIQADFKKRSSFLTDLAYLTIKEKKQLLILVPEITHLEKIKEALSDIPAMYVATVHASMSKKDLRQTWQQLQTKTPKVIIGTQKALFLPFTTLIETVIEEDYYPAHKLFDQYPRLQNMYAIKQLAAIHKARVTVSSSFASLRSYYAMENKAVEVVQNESLEPKVTTYSFTFEDRKKKHLLPSEFAQKLSAWMNSGKKIFVLYNRRGTWQALVCSDCKTAVRCKKCHVAVVVHGNSIKCHHCGTTEEIPKVCPSCKKKKLHPMKPGGETMTQVFKAFTKHGSLVQIDADTVKEKTEAALQKEIKKANVVVGTIAAFTHLQDQQFDEVVWLYPEQSLQYPDIRSTERGMNTLARLQQFMKGHTKLTLVVRQPQILSDTLDMSLKKFYEKQLKERKRSYYPPYADLIRLTFGDKKKEKALSRAEKLRDILEQRLEKKTQKVIIRGPFQGYIKAKKGYEEAHLLLQGSIAELAPLYADLSVDVVDIDPSRIL